MLNIEVVDLATRGVIFPGDRVGMVMAQPYVQLTPAEPYVWQPAFRSGQLAAVNKTLAISKAAYHGASKTHFTVFPEYSIPGLDGIALIDDAMSQADWPDGTVVIGGTDALTSADFQNLARQSNTFVNQEDGANTRILINEWVNCAIIWVKGTNGVEKWLQPKIAPAWDEQNIRHQFMFQGNSVFVFKGLLGTGAPYLFSTLVCFDWIGSSHGTKLWQQVLEHLSQRATQVSAELSLSWFFVIQKNKKPSHDTFLLEVTNFFNQTIFNNVHRERSCLIFANTAGKAGPGISDSYGSSSLVFSEQSLFEQPTCIPTFCNGGRHFRASTLLSSCHDILFRERGACIHSFDDLVARTVALDERR